MTSNKSVTVLPPFRQWRGLVIRERRQEQRYRTNDAAEVRVLPLNGITLRAVVVDVSRSGVGLEMETRLEKHTRVEIELPRHKTMIFGEVRCCVRSTLGFHVGVLTKDAIYDPNVFARIL